MSEQLALDILLNEQASFDNFNWLGNEVLKHHLHDSLSGTTDERIFYLWGPTGSGKSHLLQGCCQFIQATTSIYLPLRQFAPFGPDALQGIEHNELICLDDIDCIAGDKDWETALFHLYNRVRDTATNFLFISGPCSPTTLNIQLPDLRSRLAWGMVFQLNELSDDGKIQTLQERALERGLELSPSVCHYLIKRCSRKLSDLLSLLHHLDKASLAAQRKITIPFIKNTLPI